MNLKKFINIKNLKRYKKITDEINVIYRSLFTDTTKNIAEQLLEIKNSLYLSDKRKTLFAIALAKKAAFDTLHMPYYDVQIIGALSLIDGCIAEMKTGEGKTLTCSAVVATNYVLGYTTHIATANEYLAKRDQETLEKLYTNMGISSNYTISTSNKEEKKQAYLCDVIYSTAQEFGFDFLKDNLVYSLEEKNQNINFSKTKVIIDEADFILIDEARTPLIISGEAPLKDSVIYYEIKKFINTLKQSKINPDDFKNSNIKINDDFWLDERTKEVHLTENGYLALEKMAQTLHLSIPSFSQVPSLYQEENSWLINETLNALKAKYFFIKDKDYILEDNNIIIIDSNSGRLSHGRTWSNGLHQAIECKENVQINPENKTLGSISIQNYFKNYFQICGMSGTIMESSDEFEDIYNCKTIEIPTNKKMIRINHHDKIYLSFDVKYNKIIDDIKQRFEKGQPLLIGTTSVMESEIISQLLHKNKIPHNVLNAKNNAIEAQIIASAGQPYCVTVATSMAGRGTDIILGGNKQILNDIFEKQINEIDSIIDYMKNKCSELNIKIVDRINFNQNNNLYKNNFTSFHLQEKLNYFYNKEQIDQDLKNNLDLIWNKIYQLREQTLMEKNTLHQEWNNWAKQVIQLGGLCVIGTSRNTSRRIDDQLRGRAGRQGDKGESIFYLSIEDSWVSVLGNNPLFKQLSKNINKEQVLSHPSLSKVFLKAQRSIEGQHFDTRKHLFQYDSVANEGRNEFLKIRNALLLNQDLIKEILFIELENKLYGVISQDFIHYISDNMNCKMDINSILKLSIKELVLHIETLRAQDSYVNLYSNNSLDKERLFNKLTTYINEIPNSDLHELSKKSLIYIDELWINHLAYIEEAQRNVGLTTLSQKNPLYEYKKICFKSFSYLVDKLKSSMINEILI